MNKYLVSTSQLIPSGRSINGLWNFLLCSHVWLKLLTLQTRNLWFQTQRPNWFTEPHDKRSMIPFCRDSTSSALVANLLGFHWLQYVVFVYVPLNCISNIKCLPTLWAVHLLVKALTGFLVCCQDFIGELFISLVKGTFFTQMSRHS